MVKLTESSTARGSAAGEASVHRGLQLRPRGTVARLAELKVVTLYCSVVYDSSSGQFAQLKRPIPQPGEGEVLLEVSCCTLCGSDLHTYCGRRNAPEQCILGHEMIGRIVSWNGPPPTDFDGQALSAGTRVTWCMAVGCGKCFYCQNRLSQKCVSLFKYGHESAVDQPPTGGLSQYCLLVPGTPIFRVPDVLPDFVACPANCATATVSAALRLASETHSLHGATAAVIGVGMLGLTAIAMLHDAGCSQIVAVDQDIERLQLAGLFGASHTVNVAKQEGLASTLAKATAGRGADLVLDFAGNKPAVQSAMEASRTGGCVILAGSVFPTPSLDLSPETVVRRMLTIRGLHNYIPRDLKAGLEFLERTYLKYPFEQLVGPTFSLRDTKQAFEYARDERRIRVAIRPGAFENAS